jgi:hypothetical protein
MRVRGTWSRAHFGLISWFRRPCSRAPSHETVFTFSCSTCIGVLAFLFFLCVFIAWWCCCVVAVERTCAFPNVEAVPRNKDWLYRFCLSMSRSAVFSLRSCFGIE